MTRLSALTDVREKVAAGEWWENMVRPRELHTDLCWKAFNDSTDAALKLCEEVLPGHVRIEMIRLDNGTWLVNMGDLDSVENPILSRVSTTAPSAASAPPVAPGQGTITCTPYDADRSA